ncbi:MAG TPA: serine hydroxymethyltransferase [Candidatus Megaira endosymbiont of Hartmannula sinica]|nr:serine hydroxymethyltransferase [Candidatus Megaera endosymbiont of Hartmannula sinica]
MILDKEINSIINSELDRQKSCMEMIASENFTSIDVMRAQGSILTNKYAEGYPGKRYYCGCEEIDKVENIAIERLKNLYNASYANVQPHSGSQANQAAFLALLNPGDKILGMSLDGGGHLTHGSLVNLSGKWFEAYSYSVNKETFLIDYDEVLEIAMQVKPKLIIAGFSCYSRKIDFGRFREIADKVGAILLADMAHISGIVAGGYHQNPIEYADVVTSTTHKTLRGPRGGIILTNDQAVAKKIDKAVFPGLQGGPLEHVIAAKAIAFGEALQDSFKDYIKNVISNAQSLSKTLLSRGYNILTRGTDNHIVIIDLRDREVTGKFVAESLDRAGITCNKNSIAFEKRSPFITSGIRLGSPALTTRGLKEEDFNMVGNLIADIIDSAIRHQSDEDKLVEFEKETFVKVKNIMSKFPLYSELS